MAVHAHLEQEVGRDAGPAPLGLAFGLRLPGRQENLHWLGGRLDEEARNLANVMSRAGLLPRPVQLGRLAVADFVERGA